MFFLLKKFFSSSFFFFLGGGLRFFWGVSQIFFFFFLGVGFYRFYIFWTFFGFFRSFWIFFWIFRILLTFLDFWIFEFFWFFLFFWVFFGFISKLLMLLLKVIKVTTGHQKLPKVGQNSLITSFFARRAKQASAEGRSLPQELEVGPRSGPYFLVLLKGVSTTWVGETLNWHGSQVNLRYDKCGLHFKTVDVTPPNIQEQHPWSSWQGPPGPQEVSRWQKTEAEGQESCSQSTNWDWCHYWMSMKLVLSQKRKLYPMRMRKKYWDIWEYNQIF